MGRRPGFIVEGFTDVEAIPSPNRMIPRISVEIRMHWPSNATLEEAQKLLTQVYAQAFAGLSERLEARDDHA